MKIILATGIFPPDIGGPATYTEKLAKEFCDRKIKTQVICYSDVKEYGNYDFSVIRILRKYFRHFLYFYKLLRIAKGVDIIYAQNAMSAGLPSLIAAKILRKRIVIKIVGDCAWEQARNKHRIKDNIDIFQNKKYKWRIEFFRKLRANVCKRADKIIVPSKYLRDMVIGWGIPQDKIKVIYNAIEIDLPASKLDITKARAKEEIGIQGDIILSIGRLVSWKGFAALLDIIQDLIKQNSKLNLIIVGEGPERKNLELKIQDLNIENNVKLAGRINHQDMFLYFKACDIFILNSEYEGLSHTILEAMFMKVPIIASNKGGNLELVENGFNGFLCEYNNKEQIKSGILELRENKNLQEKFIKNSQDKLKDFNWENLVEQTIKILKVKA
jgi:glycosyltransferase involved in cell wall biosynthesis